MLYGLPARADQRRRKFDPERLGGFEIDHRLVLGRRLHRKVRRVLAPEDVVYVAGSAPMRINSFWLSMP